MFDLNKSFSEEARALMTSSHRKDLAIILLLCSLSVLSWIPRLSGPIDFRWDASVYYILGTSLAEGKGYRLLNEPGDIEANQYPPLFPAIIAAHQWAIGTSDPIIVGHWLRLSLFLIFILYILFIYLMLRGYLPAIYAFLATLVCLFNLHTYFMSDLCFPDILFGLATILFVLSNKNNNRGIYPILTSLFATVSYALRSIGITLFVAWVAESLLNRELKRAAVRLTLALIPILCWQSYISFVESGPKYKNPVYEYQRADYLFYNVSYAKNIFSFKDPFSPELGHASFEDIAERFLHNLVEIPSSLGEAVSFKKRYLELQWAAFTKRLPFPLDAPWVVSFAMIILGCFILGGIIIQLAKRQWVIPIYVLGYLAALCLTPWPGQFNRYLVPLTPFLALSLFKMLLTIGNQSYKILPAKWKAIGSVLMGSIVFLILMEQTLIFYVVYTKSHKQVVYNDKNGKEIVYRLFFYSDSYRALDAGLDWLERKAKPGDIVAATMPHWVYLRTRLKAVMPPFELDPVKAQKLLDSVPVSYLILDEGLAFDTRKYTTHVVQNFPGRWKRVYSDSVVTESGEELKGRFEIYQRVDPQIPPLRGVHRLTHTTAFEDHLIPFPSGIRQIIEFVGPFNY
jgi:hypothetical protein